MKDLRKDLSNLYRTAARQTPKAGCRSIMFVSAREGEGTSSMAASFAMLAASRATRNAWLVDLDFRHNQAFHAFEDGFAGVRGISRSYDGSLGVAPLYEVTPAYKGDADQPRLLTVNQVEGARLLVTNFRNKKLSEGQQVRLLSRPEYWSKLKTSTDWIVVDTPSFERSSNALIVAPEVDSIVIVARADETEVEDVAALRLELEAQGGRVLGVALNSVRADARFVDRLGI